MPLGELNGRIIVSGVGLPGIPTVFILSPEFRGRSPNHEERLTDTTERKFAVVAELGERMPTHGTLHLVADPRQGDSLLRIPLESKEHKFVTTAGEYTVAANADHRMASICREIVATNWNAAVSNFVAGLFPALDRLSFTVNVPISIRKITLGDIQNKTTYILQPAPFSEVTLPAHWDLAFFILGPCYALWRESKNSGSSYYSFLCQVKILEGVLFRILPSIHKAAKDQGITIVAKQLLVPPHPELKRFNADLVGKRIHEVYSEVLIPDYRNALAHFRLDSGIILNPSQHSWIARFDNAVRISDVCAHYVLKEAEVLLDQLAKAGGRVPSGQE